MIFFENRFKKVPFKERLLGTVYKISTYGNKFPIEYYVSPEGFKWKEKDVFCRTCKKNKATYQLAISNHLFEPQGSEYYCGSCVPKPVEFSVA